MTNTVLDEEVVSEFTEDDLQEILSSYQLNWKRKEL